MYHEKIDSLLDTYARKLAANMNHRFAIDARVPSILIAGGSNFPVRQKEKQTRPATAICRNGSISKGCLIKSAAPAWAASGRTTRRPSPSCKKAGRAGKGAGNHESRERLLPQARHLDGCPHLSPENIENLKADMASAGTMKRNPFRAGSCPITMRKSTASGSGSKA